MSKWIQGHLATNSLNYGSIGPIIGELSKFFKNAERTLPKPGENKPIKDEEIASFFEDSFTESMHNVQVLREKISALEQENVIKKESESLVTIHKRERVCNIKSAEISNEIKKSKFSMNSNCIEIIDDSDDEPMFVEPAVIKIVPSDRRDILKMVDFFFVGFILFKIIFFLIFFNFFSDKNKDF